jgi:hypothetical protein
VVAGQACTITGRVLAALLGVFWGFLFYGLIDLLVFLQGPEFHSSFHLETGWGLFYLFVVSAPLLVIAGVPQHVQPAAVQQVLLSGVAVAAGALVSVSAKHLLSAAALCATAGLVAMFCGGVRAMLPRPRRWAPVPGALVLLAVGPCLVMALKAGAAARAGRHLSITNGLAHWPVEAALAVAVILLAALAATRPRGWILPAWTVGICAVWYGTASVIYPNLDATVGRTWGVLAVTWGVAFVLVSHLTSQRPDRRHE